MNKSYKVYVEQFVSWDHKTGKKTYTLLDIFPQSLFGSEDEAWQAVAWHLGMDIQDLTLKSGVTLNQARADSFGWFHIKEV